MAFFIIEKAMEPDRSWLFFITGGDEDDHRNEG
jgi:hypothetical protein